MALLGFEGFDPYGTAAQAGQYLNQAVVGALGLNTTNPRTGRACLSFGGSAQAFRMSFSRGASTLIAGVAVNWTASFANGSFPLRFWASTQVRSSILLSVNASGNLLLARGLANENAGGGGGNLGTTLWTGSEIEPQNTWVYYELKVLLAASASGAVTLRRNNQLVVALANVQTLVNAADDVNSVIIDRSLSGMAYLADDLYVADGAGTGNNDFLGDVRARTLLPASTLASGWTPAGGGSNLGKIQDITPDDDAGHVSTVTAGTVDRFGLTALPASTAAVRGLRPFYRGRKEDAGIAETRLLLRSGTTLAEGAVDAPDTSYRYFSGLWQTDPATGAAWTPAAVNALELGYERLA